MLFGTRSLLALMTGIGALLGITIAVPPLLVPVASLILAFLMAAGAILITTLLFFVVDKVTEVATNSRARTSSFSPDERPK